MSEKSFLRAIRLSLVIRHFATTLTLVVAAAAGVLHVVGWL